MRHPLRCALVLLLLPATLPNTQAGLLVDEPFDYPAESHLPDFTAERPVAVAQPASLGGTGLTLQPKPFPDRLPLDIAKSGLSYTDAQGRALRTSGLAALIPNGHSAIFSLYDSDSEDPFAKLRNPNEPRELGNPGGVIWLSFLVTVEAEPGPTDTFSLRFSGTKMSFPIGLLARGSSGANNFGVVSTTSKVALEPNQTYLVVLRFVLGETGEADLWINPDLGGERPDAKPDLHFTNTTVFMRSLWFHKSTSVDLPVVFDEVRVGETYADVTPSL